MAKRKKKNDRALLALLLLLILLAAYLLWTGWSPGSLFPSSDTPTPSTDEKCCCDNPFAWIIHQPGKACQCLVCPDVTDNIIIKENGEVCCTDNFCAGSATTSTTIPGVQPCASILDDKLCGYGYCTSGMYCVSSTSGGCFCVPPLL